MSVQPVVNMQPGVFLSPDLKTDAWGTGICDCCEDMGICCFGFWCPCCLMCSTTSEFKESLCLPLLDIMCSGVIPSISLSMRSAMRERYRIKGTMCTDCLVVTCCTSCAWCQMARELKSRRHPLILNSPAGTPLVLNPVHIPQPMPSGQYPAVPQWHSAAVAN